jgi:hypothetical protein
LHYYYRQNADNKIGHSNDLAIISENLFSPKIYSDKSFEFFVITADIAFITNYEPLLFYCKAIIFYSHILGIIWSSKKNSINYFGIKTKTRCRNLRGLGGLGLVI